MDLKGSFWGAEDRAAVADLVEPNAWTWSAVDEAWEVEESSPCPGFMITEGRVMLTHGTLDIGLDVDSCGGHATTIRVLNQIHEAAMMLTKHQECSTVPQLETSETLEKVISTHMPTGDLVRLAYAMGCVDGGVDLLLAFTTIADSGGGLQDLKLAMVDAKTILGREMREVTEAASNVRTPRRPPPIAKPMPTVD